MTVELEELVGVDVEEEVLVVYAVDVDMVVSVDDCVEDDVVVEEVVAEVVAVVVEVVEYDDVDELEAVEVSDDVEDVDGVVVNVVVKVVLEDVLDVDVAVVVIVPYSTEKLVADNFTLPTLIENCVAEMLCPRACNADTKSWYCGAGEVAGACTNIATLKLLRLTAILAHISLTP